MISQGKWHVGVSKPYIVYAEGGRPIAIIHSQGGTLHEGEQQSNAAFIADSPAILEAMCDLCLIHTKDAAADDLDPEEVISRARQLIYKYA